MRGTSASGMRHAAADAPDSPPSVLLLRDTMAAEAAAAATAAAASRRYTARPAEAVSPPPALAAAEPPTPQQQVQGGRLRRRSSGPRLSPPPPDAGRRSGSRRAASISRDSADQYAQVELALHSYTGAASDPPQRQQQQQQRSRTPLSTAQPPTFPVRGTKKHPATPRASAAAAGDAGAAAPPPPPQQQPATHRISDDPFSAAVAAAADGPPSFHGNHHGKQQPSHGAGGGASSARKKTFHSGANRRGASADADAACGGGRLDKPRYKPALPLDATPNRARSRSRSASPNAAVAAAPAKPQQQPPPPPPPQHAARSVSFSSHVPVQQAATATATTAGHGDEAAADAAADGEEAQGAGGGSPPPPPPPASLTAFLQEFEIAERQRARQLKKDYYLSQHVVMQEIERSAEKAPAVPLAEAAAPPPPPPPSQQPQPFSADNNTDATTASHSAAHTLLASDDAFPVKTSSRAAGILERMKQRRAASAEPPPPPQPSQPQPHQPSCDAASSSAAAAAAAAGASSHPSPCRALEEAFRISQDPEASRLLSSPPPPPPAATTDTLVSPELLKRFKHVASALCEDGGDAGAEAEAEAEAEADEAAAAAAEETEEEEERAAKAAAEHASIAEGYKRRSEALRRQMAERLKALAVAEAVEVEEEEVVEEEVTEEEASATVARSSSSPPRHRPPPPTTTTASSSSSAVSAGTQTRPPPKKPVRAPTANAVRIVVRQQDQRPWRTPPASAVSAAKKKSFAHTHQQQQQPQNPPLPDESTASRTGSRSPCFRIGGSGLFSNPDEEHPPPPPPPPQAADAAAAATPPPAASSPAPSCPACGSPPRRLAFDVETSPAAAAAAAATPAVLRLQRWHRRLLRQRRIQRAEAATVVQAVVRRRQAMRRVAGLLEERETLEGVVCELLRTVREGAFKRRLKVREARRKARGARVREAAREARRLEEKVGALREEQEATESVLQADVIEREVQQLARTARVKQADAEHLADPEVFEMEMEREEANPASDFNTLSARDVDSLRNFLRSTPLLDTPYFRRKYHGLFLTAETGRAEHALPASSPRNRHFHHILMSAGGKAPSPPATAATVPGASCLLNVPMEASVLVDDGATTAAAAAAAATAQQQQQRPRKLVHRASSRLRPSPSPRREGSSRAPTSPRGAGSSALGTRFGGGGGVGGAHDFVCARARGTGLSLSRGASPQKAWEHSLNTAVGAVETAVTEAADLTESWGLVASPGLGDGGVAAGLGVGGSPSLFEEGRAGAGAEEEEAACTEAAAEAAAVAELVGMDAEELAAVSAPTGYRFEEDAVYVPRAEVVEEEASGDDGGDDAKSTVSQKYGDALLELRSIVSAGRVAGDEKAPAVSAATARLPPPLEFPHRLVPTIASSSMLLTAALALHLTHHFPAGDNCLAQFPPAELASAFSPSAREVCIDVVRCCWGQGLFLCFLFVVLLFVLAASTSRTRHSSLQVVENSDTQYLSGEFEAR